MSRMAIPTMDVVRFKEDDIIVASSHRTANWKNLGNGTTGDASLHLQNGVPVDATYSQIKGELTGDKTSFFYPDMLFINGSAEATLAQIIAAEGNADSESSYSGWDGDYLAQSDGWHKQ